MSPNSSLISLFAKTVCVCKLSFTGNWKSADGQWDYRRRKNNTPPPPNPKTKTCILEVPVTGRASPLAKMPYCPVLAGERGEPVLLSLFLKYTIFFRGELSSLHLGRDTQKHHSRGIKPTLPAFPLTPSCLSPAWGTSQEVPPERAGVADRCLCPWWGERGS